MAHHFLLPGFLQSGTVNERASFAGNVMISRTPPTIAAELNDESLELSLSKNIVNGIISFFLQNYTCELYLRTVTGYGNGIQFCWRSY